MRQVLVMLLALQLVSGTSAVFRCPTVCTGMFSHRCTCFSALLPADAFQAAHCGTC